MNTATCHQINNQPSTLDLFFTSKLDSIVKLSSCSPLGKSDHTVLKVVVDFQLHHNAPKPMHIFSKGDYTAMKTALSNWVLTDGPLDEMHEGFTQKIHEIVDAYIPKTKPSLNLEHSNKFLDRTTQKLICKKHRLFQRYFETKDLEKWNAYARVRNQDKSKVRVLRRQEE